MNIFSEERQKELKEFRERHPELMKVLNKNICVGAGAILGVLAVSGLNERSKLMLSNIKDKPALNESKTYTSHAKENYCEDYVREIIRKVNPRQKMNITDMYIAWMPQSSIESIMDAYNESKSDYYD